jgi:hypothetical protein
MVCDTIMSTLSIYSPLFDFKYLPVIGTYCLLFELFVYFYVVPKDYITEQLKQKFSGKTIISRDELFNFYKSFEPDLKESTFAWRIYSLKEKGILKPVKRGVYTFSVKPQFHAPIEIKLKEIALKVGKQFPAARYCVWSTRWLNDVMIHQPGKFLLLVEAEQSATESVFYFLKDAQYKNVFLNPDDNVIERYVSEQIETIIVKPLVTKAPVKKEKNISVPTLEKILVDLFVERKIFAAYQGQELINIYNNLFKSYALNVTKLLSYAQRRTKEKELLDFISNNTLLTELLAE